MVGPMGLSGNVTENVATNFLLGVQPDGKTERPITKLGYKNEDWYGSLMLLQKLYRNR